MKFLVSRFFILIFGILGWSMMPVFAQADSLSTFPIDSGYHTSFDGTKIYYESIGIGTPVLLVHGFIVNSSTWKRTALYADLLQNGFRVITMDLRGNGRSDKPNTDKGYANDAEAKDIISLLKALSIKRYNAVGYSRGSIITARLLVLDKNIGAAVLGGMGADFTNPEWPRRIQFYKALSGEKNKDFEGALQYIERTGADKQALAMMQKHQPSTTPAALGNIQVPVLIISGDKDNDNGSAEELGRLIPKSVVVRTPGVHNTANGTKEFSTAVIRFLAQ